jgi:GNAT superfamily N-acetyltransferase
MSLPTVHPNTSPEPTAHKNWNWIPIRSLGPRHRERITQHLLALSDSDRYLRFGYAATDAQMSKYVDMLDFEHDEVFGIFNRKLVLIAMAHLAHSIPGPNAGDPPMSEFGVSALTQARGRGFGARLFEHAMLHARNRGVRTLFIHALSENVAMLKIARNAGATIERSGSESDARVVLPPDTIASHVDELVEHQAAELDYQLKVKARQVNGLLDTIAEVKDSVGRSSRVAQG